MKKLIAMTIMSLAAFTANAETLDLSQLTSEQVAQIKTQAAGMTKSSDPLAVTVRKEVSEWGQLGVSMGQAMIGAAKEIGVAASDFAETPLGKVTTVIIVWKMVGKDILGVIFGTAILMLGVFFGNRVINAGRVRKYQITPTPYFWGLYTLNKRVLSSNEPADSEESAIYMLCGIVIILGSVAMAAGAMF